MFLISDDYGDFKRIMNYKEAREFLIDEIVEDSKQNHTEYDIISLNVKQLGELSKNNLITDKYLIDNLKSYGWNVINVSDLQKDINDLREYLFGINGNDKIVNELDDILKYIDKELR